MDILDIVGDCIDEILIQGGYLPRLMFSYTCRAATAHLPKRHDRLPTDQLLFLVIKEASASLIEYYKNPKLKLEPTWNLLFDRQTVLVYIGANLPLDIKRLLFGDDPQEWHSSRKRIIIEAAIPFRPSAELKCYRGHIDSRFAAPQKCAKNEDQYLVLLEGNSPTEKLEFLCRRGDTNSFEEKDDKLAEYVTNCETWRLPDILGTAIKFGHYDVLGRIIDYIQDRAKIRPGYLFKIALENGAPITVLQYLAGYITAREQLKISFKLQTLSMAAVKICLATSEINRARPLCILWSSKIHVWEGFDGRFWSSDQKNAANS